VRVAIVAHLLYLGHWFIVLNIWGGELGLFLSVIANNCVVDNYLSFCSSASIIN